MALHICKLFGGLSQVFVDELWCHYLTNSFCPIVINQVIVVNKDIVPIVVNTSLRTRTGRNESSIRGGMKSSKMSIGRNASKKVGNHCSRQCEALHYTPVSIFCCMF